MKAFQFKETGSCRIAAGMSDATVMVSVGHAIQDIDNPTSDPDDIVVVSIEREGTDLVDTIGIRPENAFALADAIAGMARLCQGSVDHAKFKHPCDAPGNEHGPV